MAVTLTSCATPQGPVLDRFERLFADRVEARHAAAVSSGTAGLHLCVRLAGIGPGDEVLVPECTWVATASAVTYVGATPVMVDVQADTWCMDPEAAERAITSRTRAMIPVHLYGQPADMLRLVPLARSRGLAIIEDAAPALGATIRTAAGWRPVGGFGDIACFSFQRSRHPRQSGARNGSCPKADDRCPRKCS